MNKKITWGVVIVIVAILGVYSINKASLKPGKVYQDTVSTPSPIPSNSDWKTYTNQTFGFKIKYPSNWSEGTLATDRQFLNLLNGENSITGQFLGPYKCTCTEREIEEILISDVVYDGSGMHPKLINEFTKVTIAGNQFYKIRTGRFEGVLSYNYYLPKDTKVFVFTFTSRGVDWTNQNLDEEKDPSHVVLKNILETLTFTN